MMKRATETNGSGGAPHSTVTNVEIAIFKKAHGTGPATKIISPTADGVGLVKDGSHCRMWAGTASRWAGDWRQVADIIDNLPQDTVLALGSLPEWLTDQTPVVQKDKLESAAPGSIARTRAFLKYKKAPSLVLLDFDDGGTPEDICERCEAAGGPFEMIRSLCPTIGMAGYIRQAGTSAGIYNPVTGFRSSSTSEHVYLLVEDGADAARFIKALAALCWLNGLGWFNSSKTGAMLPRTIIDICVVLPEHLCFEAAPVLVAPLQQDPRTSVVHDGPPLNSVGAMLEPTKAHGGRTTDRRREGDHQTASRPD
jgi:hypothetical protein